MNLGRASREELIQLVGQLLDHVEALEARISELEGRQKPPTEEGKERKPPSWVKANRPDRPRKERQKRTHGFARRREEPTHRVEHATASCPDCGTMLRGGRVRRRRQIITIPQVRARVSEHVVLERTCRKCGQRWSPELDWSALVVGQQRVGISVQQEVCVLREECRLPYGVIQRYLKWRYRLGLSVGELVALVRGVAQRGQEEYHQLQEEIRASPVVYGDETGWREDGRNGYLWSFSTPKVRCFLRRASRGGPVVEEVLGDEFDGVLVSDFYGAYNVHQGLHQRCWTHPVSSTGQALLRDIHQLKEKHPQHQGLAGWAQEVREVYDQAQALSRPGPRNCRETVRQSQRVKQQQQTSSSYGPSASLTWAAMRPCACCASGWNASCRSCFTFVAEPRASADNNAAERSLRPTVVSRKISGGTRSPEGSNTKSVPGFPVRHLALARPQPLPSPELHPLPIPTCPSLNSYGVESVLTILNC